MSLTFGEKQKLNEFAYEESQWLDEIVRQVHPRFARFAESRKPSFFKNTLLYILAKSTGFSVARAQDTEVFSKSTGYRIRSVTTTVLRKGVEIAKKKFIVNVIIKSNP